MSLVGVLLTLTACSEGLDLGEYGACSSIDQWIVRGNAADEFDRVVSHAASSLADADDDALVAAASALISADEPHRDQAAADFMAACRNSGWSPPEG